MLTLMYYTNLLFLLTILLVSGCASGPDGPSSDDTQSGNTVISTSGEEVILYRKGITALYKNNLDEAEQLFFKIIKLQPDLAGPWANLGLVYLKQGHLDKALKNANIALEKNPKMAQAHNLIGYISTKQGHILEARDHYIKAISYKQDYALAHYNLALLYDTYFQDLPKAIEQYEHYLKLVEHKDKKTAEWVEELKRNLARKTS